MDIYKIAALAKVSISTVSRVINHQSVSAKKKVKVLKVIRRCHYHPDVSAQSLGRKSHHHPHKGKIGVFFALFLFFVSLATTPCRAAVAPTLGTVSPASGSCSPEATVLFATTFNDGDGWQTISMAQFLVNTTSAKTNCCYTYYDRVANLLYLRDDANTAWLGGYAPGSQNSISNSYCRLDCSQTTVTGSGSTLKVCWAVVFTPFFTGAKNTYLYVKDSTNRFVSLTKKGTWTINNQTPVAESVTPASGGSAPGQPVVFSTDYSDNDGWKNIQYVYFHINTTSSKQNCFYGYYSQDTNMLYLRNETNMSWSGGYAPGSDNIIENNYAILDCARTAVSGEGSHLIVQWSVTFKQAFLGQKKMYLYVKDDAGAAQGFVQKGTWLVSDADVTAPTGSITINNGSQYTNTQQVNLSVPAEDNPGGSGVAIMQFSSDGVSWSGAENYAASKSWQLPDGDGAKTVAVRFQDKAGNWSDAYSDSIVYDTQAPDILIDRVNDPTNQDVVVSYAVSDNFSSGNEITVTGDGSPYVVEGEHTVTLTAVDKAGNASNAAISFTIDKTPPVITIISPQSGEIVESQTVELKGSVDGVAFVDYVTLSQEGQNTITKTAQDAAGNCASASVTVNYYLGQLVGPEGGEVTSADGRIKLIIPPGALSTPQHIKVVTVDKAVLEAATPGDRSLLSVVECKPYGLVFAKPVEIIYTLAQAEVPGTAIELGLYDAAQGMILSTGQSSIIPSDGYTLNFTLMHFSTYAALKNLTPQSSPIGAGVQVPLPDMFTGAFSHAIPLTVVPGRKGVQPNLALVYRSGNPNSWVGLGFSLNPGYIVRSTRLGAPSYHDTQDTFYVVTDAGSTELVWLVDNLYQAKIESAFTKFYKESDDTWKAVSKDGSVVRFGQGQNAKEISGEGTYSWYVTRSTDTNGNYVEYSYTKDDGKSYLSAIAYTGNEQGVAPTNSVEFILEGRDDITSSYISTSRIAIDKRLKEIQVKLRGELVWRYEIEYGYSQDTNRSLVSSVTQSGADGKSVPTQRFTYQRAQKETAE